MDDPNTVEHEVAPDHASNGATGAARAKVAELHDLLARTKAQRAEWDRRQAELFERLESKLDAARGEATSLEERRSAAEARIAHLEHTLAQAVRRLALIDEKLAAAGALAEQDGEPGTD